MKNCCPSRLKTFQLSLAQTFYYSSLYYIFPAMMPYITQERGYSLVEYNSAITIILVTSGILAPLMGKFTDKFKGILLTGIAGILGGIAIILIPVNSSIIYFYILSFFIGIASSMGLYEVCFSHLTRVYGSNSKNSITAITLMAGFASTITFPFARFCALNLSWQWGFYVLGSITVLIGITLVIRHFRVTVEEFICAKSHESKQVSTTGHNRLVLFLLPLFLLIMCKSLIMFTNTTIHTQILPLLSAMGIPDGRSVFVASCFGPMQVLGRIILLITNKKSGSNPVFITLLMHISITIAAILFMFSNKFNYLIIFFVMLHGSSIGVFSILNPQVNSTVFGRNRVGKISGSIAFFSQITTALAPLVASIVSLRFGILSIPMVLVLTTLAALISFYFIYKNITNTTQPQPNHNDNLT